MHIREVRLTPTLAQDVYVFPGVRFNAPPITVTCWEQLSDGQFRLTSARSVHWHPQLDGPNLTLTLGPSPGVLVRVLVEDDDSDHDLAE